MLSYHNNKHRYGYHPYHPYQLVDYKSGRITNTDTT